MQTSQSQTNQSHQPHPKPAIARPRQGRYKSTRCPYRVSPRAQSPVTRGQHQAPEPWRINWCQMQNQWTVPSRLLLLLLGLPLQHDNRY